MGQGHLGRPLGSAPESTVHIERKRLALPDIFARAQALLIDFAILFIPTFIELIFIKAWLENRG